MILPSDSPLVPMASRVCSHVLVGVLLAGAGSAQKAQPSVDLSMLHLRPVGPAVMGGRVVDLAVREDRPSTFYVATASGGLWKTVNNGTTFEPLFQHEKVMSIGAIALCQSDPQQIWVGTGEANNRNSTPWGSGVYFSKDGGKTWKFKGLPKSYHIGRIAIHPKDPKTVFVAACGSLWGPNPERGLYRTRDGGATWELVVSVDAKTGATEVRIDPENPDIVYCATYERQRDAFDGNHPAKRWGPGSGLYKSSDGGTTWKKLTKGLPTVDMGRISLDIYRKDPSHVYALIETEKIGTKPTDAPKPKLGPVGSAFMGFSGAEDAAAGPRLGTVVRGGPSDTAGIEQGDIVIELAGVGTATYAELLQVLGEQRAHESAKVKVLRDGKVIETQVTFGDKRQQRGGSAAFADRIGGQVANRLRQQGPSGFQTGGTFLSKDHGETWTRINTLNPRPYYFSQIRVDPSDEKNLYVPGIQFHFSFDGGKTFRTRTRAVTMAGVHVDYHAMWIDPRDGRHMLLGCDGGVNATYDRCKSWEVFENIPIGQAYHAVADTRRPYWIYAGYQDNGSWGSPSATGYTDGIGNEDVFKVGGGDGFVCRVDPEDPDVVFAESQGGTIRWSNLRTGQRGGVRRGGNILRQMRGGRDRVRRGAFNWDTPFFLSRWNSRTIYFAGDRAYKSIDRGRTTTAISKQLTNAPVGEPSALPSATEFVESPRSQGLLWVGTDDGNLWVTRDDGRTWTDRSKIIHALLPGGRAMWVGGIAPSHHSDGRAFVAIDGHRSNDRRPYLFVTEDFGAKWRDLSKALPADAGSVHAVYEDDANADLLCVGAEMGLFISLDRGKSFRKLGKPFPTVAVRDFDLQKREQHLILATHGRSVWVLDIRALRDLTETRRKSIRLVPPNDVLRLTRRSRSRQGHRHFRVANPPTRATFYYWLDKPCKEPIAIVVRDVLGKEVWRADGKRNAGLHRADWNLRVAPASARSRKGGAGLTGLFRGARRALRGRRSGPPATSGTYSVALEVGSKKQIATFKIQTSTRPSDVALPRQAFVGEGGGLEVTQDEPRYEGERSWR